MKPQNYATITQKKNQTGFFAEVKISDNHQKQGDPILIDSQNIYFSIVHGMKDARTVSRLIMKGIKDKIIYSVLGGIIALFMAIVVMTFIADKIDYTPKRILTARALNASNVLASDSLSSVKIDFLRDLEESGVLLSPQEYTGHVLQFYSTLVAVLVGLFVAFSFLSFFIINDNSNKRFERRANDLDKEVRKYVVDNMKEVMRDSREFDVRLASLVKNGINKEQVTKENLDLVKNDLLKYADELDALFILYDELDEKISEWDNIID